MFGVWCCFVVVGVFVFVVVGVFIFVLFVVFWCCLLGFDVHGR